ncbi:MAG TPA: glycosyltransferase N-terminal domain-containing protein [Thermoanaerobaculia bacterium]|nr:glycosyltransferase N-terminal domain-containing protein [Thermoanaerobaculia bacterium]
MATLFWMLYQAALALALAASGPFLLARRGRHYLPTLAGRLGLGVSQPGAECGGGRGGLWLHAVSVGEVGVAATLAGILPRDLPLLVTTVTPTGQARARTAFAGRAAVAYLPFDLGPALGSFLRRFAPRALVLVEGDYWPLLLREARRRGLPVMVVNGRVGDRGFRRLRRLQPLARLLFAGVERFGVQDLEDRERLLALGVAAGRVTVTGNLKYETPDPPESPALTALLARLAGGRPLLLAGSTMAGEEEAVLAAFARLGGGGRALLVLAPRHPERWGEVAALLRARRLAVVQRSQLDPDPDADTEGVGAAPGGPAGAAARAAKGPEPAVVLLDSLGELAALYRHAAAAFIGGTLVATGGHNPLEAARFGIPIAAGPSMHNFRDMAARFDRAGAWRRVGDAAGLAAAWSEWLADPVAARAQGERARRLLEENRGALSRTSELLAPLLARLAEASGQGGEGEGRSERARPAGRKGAAG